MLLPEQWRVLRLVLAIISSIGHMSLLVFLEPYHQKLTAFFAYATSLTLVCTLQAAVWIVVRERLGELSADSFRI